MKYIEYVIVALLEHDFLEVRSIYNEFLYYSIANRADPQTRELSDRNFLYI